MVIRCWLFAWALAACSVETASLGARDLVADGGGVRVDPGGALEFDPDIVQARVSGSCEPGEAMRAIDAAGGVTCEADDDTAYAAGDGLTLAGATFSVDFGVFGSCEPGEKVVGIDAGTGEVACATDADTLAALACADGQVAKWSEADGGWACDDDVDTDTDTNSGGTVTSITAGAGLAGGTITASGTVAVDFGAVAAAGHVHDYAPAADVTAIEAELQAARGGESQLITDNAVDPTASGRIATRRVDVLAGTVIDAFRIGGLLDTPASSGFLHVYLGGEAIGGGGRQGEMSHWSFIRSAGSAYAVEQVVVSAPNVSVSCVDEAGDLLVRVTATTYDFRGALTVIVGVAYPSSLSIQMVAP